MKPIGAPGDLIEGVDFAGGRARQSGARPSRRGGVIESIEPGSPADALGIRPGDVVLRVNGHRLRDVVDYQYYTADAVLALEITRHSDPDRSHIVRMVRDGGEPLGIQFTQPTFAPIRECNNHCPFCFIDQLPAEMRSSLYIRDDDYRYSFLFGNFVTLTNLNERDWTRLAEQRLSPLYVSVHATDPDLRRLLLGNDRAPDIRAQLRRLFHIGIQVHTQVVVCPGINDGEALHETVTELAAHYPNVLSIGVVPVGLTRTPAEILAGPGASCSRILPSAADLPLRSFTAGEARRVVQQTREWQLGYRREHGRSLVYASDELYILAGKPVPSAGWYDGYPQYENGIGMVRDLLDDWMSTKRRLRQNASRSVLPNAMNLICGEMVFPVLQPLVGEWSRLRRIDARLIPIQNAFFGSRVKVSGLLTGRDVIANRERFGPGPIVLPKVMLDKTASRLLDNLSPGELEAELGRSVQFAGMMSEVDRLTQDLVDAA